MQIKSRYIYNLILIFANINQNDISILQKFAFFKFAKFWMSFFALNIYNKEPSQTLPGSARYLAFAP